MLSINNFKKISGTSIEVGTSFKADTRFEVDTIDTNLEDGTSFEVGTRIDVGTHFEGSTSVEFNSCFEGFEVGSSLRFVPALNRSNNTSNVYFSTPHRKVISTLLISMS